MGKPQRRLQARRLKGMPTPTKILVLVLIVAFSQGQPLDIGDNDYVIPERLTRSNFLRFGKRDQPENAAPNTVNTRNGMDEVLEEMTIANKVQRQSPRSFLRFGKRRSDNFLRFGKRSDEEEQDQTEDPEPCSPLGHFFEIWQVNCHFFFNEADDELWLIFILQKHG